MDLNMTISSGDITHCCQLGVCETQELTPDRVDWFSGVDYTATGIGENELIVRLVALNIFGNRTLRSRMRCGVGRAGEKSALSRLE